MCRADQSGNSADATRANAAAEGVADRVELHTADMTALPFEANTFDVVVSSMAIHNIGGNAGRRKAIDEAVRVGAPAAGRRSPTSAAPGDTRRDSPGSRNDRRHPPPAGLAILAGGAWVVTRR